MPSLETPVYSTEEIEYDFENIKNSWVEVADIISDIDGLGLYGQFMNELAESEVFDVMHPDGLLGRIHVLNSFLKTNQREELELELAHMFVFNKNHVWPDSDLLESYRQRHLVQYSKEISDFIQEIGGLKNTHGKIIAPDSGMFAGKTTKAALLYNKAQKAGYHCVGLIPSFMKQNGRIDVRALESHIDGFDFGDNELFGMIFNILNSEEIVEEQQIELDHLISGLVSSEVNRIKDTVTADGDPGKIFVLLDEYSFLPKVLLNPLIEKFLEENFIVALAGLDTDYLAEQLEGHAALANHPKRLDIAPCKSFVTQDIVLKINAEVKPEGDATRRMFPFQKKDGEIVWIESWGDGIVAMPKDEYDVMYLPIKRERHPMVRLVKASGKKFKDRIVRPVKQVIDLQVDFAKKLLVA